ncbi:MAG: Multiple RNA-binding domain-containing protein 1 [Watsoniomyces obsoletus]|nr:MAG: Multiple RNA-binding domain-containing protein 1 [Watsoniomyces obsoletus]
METSSVLILLALSVFAPSLVTGQDAGDAASGTSSTTGPSSVDSAAGASGSSSSFNLSRGGMVAIIVVAVLVGGGGLASAALFYIAKKRQWEVRKSLRRSARRLTGGLNVSGKNQRASRRQTGVKLPPTPRFAPNSKETVDLEKGGVKNGTVQTNITAVKKESSPLRR